MSEKHSGPAGVATDTARNAHDTSEGTLFGRTPQAVDGERRKLNALATLAARNPDRVRAAQGALLRLLLERAHATVDDVRAALELSDAEPARWLGCVPGELRRAGIIRRAGYVESGRAVAHCRPVSRWELADAQAARAWLRAHDPDSAG